MTAADHGSLSFYEADVVVIRGDGSVVGGHVLLTAGPVTVREQRPRRGEAVRCAFEWDVAVRVWPWPLAKP